MISYTWVTMQSIKQIVKEQGAENEQRPLEGESGSGDKFGKKNEASVKRTSSGITIKTAPHQAVSYNAYAKPSESPEALLKDACRTQHEECKELLQSNFTSRVSDPSGPIYGSSNGFVNGTIAAYNQHHHLVIRPEDVWFAILTQFSCYVNKHAEELRTHFVAHEDKKDLLVDMGTGTRYSVDFGWFAEKMSLLLEQNVVDVELRKWIMPAFTTTTKDDETTAAIIMMGTLQKYFNYFCCSSCGLPSITLKGSKADWEKILSKIDKLEDYGEEPTIWSGLLKRVLERFVMTFDDPTSEEVLNFWQRIVHENNMGSGPSYLSGWITAFCFWNQEGKLLYKDPGPKTKNNKEPDPNHSFNRPKEGLMKAHAISPNQREKGWNDRRSPYLEIEGTRYHTLDLDEIPAGYGSVPVKFDDNGYRFEAIMVAGSVGFNATSSGKPLADGKIGKDTLQPVTGWWMFEKKKTKDEAKRRTEDEEWRRFDENLGSMPAKQAWG